MHVVFLTRRFFPDIGGVETHVLAIAQQLVKEGHTVVVIAEEQNDIGHNRKSAFWQMKYASDMFLGGIKKIVFPTQKTHDYNDNQRRRLSNLILLRHISSRGLRRIIDLASQLFWQNRYMSAKVSNPVLLMSMNKKNIHTNLDKIIVKRIPYVKTNRVKKIIIWQWLWKHRSLLAQADVIHCHDVFFWYLPFRFLFPRKPVYTTFHGYEGTCPPVRKAVWIRKLSERLSFGNICIGEYIAKWYGTRPTLVLYGGIYPKKILPAQPRKNGTTSILLVGRLEPDIGISLYSKALATLTKERIPFDFEACGDGSLRKELSTYGKVHGFIPDTFPHMEKADIVFGSSYLVIIESLLAKKHVVAVYDNPLKKDVLEMTPFAPWISICSSADEIVEACKRYRYNRAHYLKVAETAYQWANAQSWEKVTKKYLQLWNEK